MNAPAAIPRIGESTPAGWPMPDMSILSAGRGSPAAMPTGMFGGLWDLISDLAEGAGAPVDYVAVGVLAVGASLVGNKRRVQPYATSNWREPCIVWMAPVGDPSSNKSPALDAATSPLRSMEADHADAHKTELMYHETRLERAKAERARWQESVKAAVKEGMPTPEMPEAAVLPDEPMRRRLVVQDATPEALGEILSGNQNGTLHLRDELAGWLMSFERYTAGGREFWLEAYGGRPHVIDRKNLKAPLRIPFNGVTVLGGIQPEKLSACLLNCADDGLVARFLWAWPNPIPYRRPRNLADVGRLEDVYRRLDRLVGGVDADGRDEPVVLPLDDGAASIFEAWMGDNAASVQEAASLYKGFVGKLGGTVLRLSLITELLAWAAASGEEPVSVSAKSVVAAIEFVEEYAKPTAIRVFGDAALPSVERNAALLARYIVKQGAAKINGRDIRRSAGIPTLKDQQALSDAIEALIEAGWLIAAVEPGQVGRPSKDFLVNPGVLANG